MTATAAFAAVVLLVVVCINMISIIRTGHQEEEILQGILDYESDRRQQESGDYPPITAMEWTGGPGSEFTIRFFAVNIDENGEIVSFSGDYILSVDDEDAGDYVEKVRESGNSEGICGDYRYKTVQDENGGTEIAFLNIADSQKNTSTLLLVSSLTGAASLLLVFVLVLFFSGRVIQPFKENIEKQKRFITDAGHELKTPLTSITTSADIAAMECEGNEWIENIRSEASRMTHLVNELVTLSRMDELDPLPEKAVFSLSDAAWETIEPFRMQAAAKNIMFSENIEEGITFYGDREAIQRMLSVLLDNAVKYTKAGGRIRFELSQNKGRCVIRVCNTCRLENTDHLDRLFDRFYRPDESRNTGTGGSGLGLSIAKAVAEAHGGSIGVSCQNGSEIEFRAVI